jgi:hypothetical protein
LEEGVKKQDIFCEKALVILFPSPAAFDLIAESLEKRAKAGNQKEAIESYLFSCLKNLEIVKKSKKMMKALESVRDQYPDQVNDIFAGISKVKVEETGPGGP